MQNDLMQVLAGEAGEEEVRRVIAAARRRRFARREVLFHEGDPADAVHFVLKGFVAVKITTELGSTVTLDLVGPGDVLGEMALLTAAGTRSATATAIETVETRVLSATAFAELRAAHPGVSDVLLALLAERVRALSARLLEALYVPADVRVVRRLLEALELYAGSEGDGVVPLTQEDLAGLAGTTRETVNRVLRVEEQRGSLSIGRGRLQVVDAPALARRAR